jgi:hypothetical protein
MSENGSQNSSTRAPGPAALNDGIAALTVREMLLVDVIAERVAELVHMEPARGRMVDAATVAAELGVERPWVYQHAAELGARRLGDGPRARLRFDLETVRRAAVALSSDAKGRSSARGAQSAVASVPQRRRLPKHRPKPGSVLMVRPRREAP